MCVHHSWTLSDETTCRRAVVAADVSFCLIGQYFWKLFPVRLGPHRRTFEIAGAGFYRPDALPKQRHSSDLVTVTSPVWALGL